MLMIDKETQAHIEKQYPGIGETILYFEKASLPAYSRCGSEDTAEVGVGLVGRSSHRLAGRTDHHVAVADSLAKLASSAQVAHCQRCIPAKANFAAKILQRKNRRASTGTYRLKGVPVLVSA